ncbi:MAG: hypothetical protein EP312_06230 [Gammaproteobacteria bacterium]|nr:MAG: hypothetical protein EP312_06230 [Gammaproteobacteria bacterium]
MKRYPPLILWLLAAGMVTLLCASLQWIARQDAEDKAAAFQHSQQQRLADYLQSAQHPRVVMFGNSLMRSALPFEALPGETPLPWLRIYSPGSDFQPFQRLWPTLMQDPPDVLILHSELLLPQPRHGDDRETAASFSDNLHRWRQWLRSLKSDAGKRAAVALRNAQLAQSRARCPAMALDWPRTQRKMASRQTRYRMDPPAKAEAFTALHDAATRVPVIILMDIPRSQSVENTFGEDTRYWRTRMQAALSDIPQLHYWQAGEPLADDCYCDYRHMKPACKPALDSNLSELNVFIRAAYHRLGTING